MKRKFVDLTGRKFGLLTPLYRTHIGDNGKKLEKISYYCSCECGGHCYATYTQLVNGNITSCGCNRGHGGKKYKLKFLDVKKTFNDRELILDANEYINSKTAMNCHDADGYKYSLSNDSVSDKRTKSFDRFCKKNKFVLYNIQHWIDLHGVQTKLLNTEYHGEKDVLNLVCECGRPFQSTWNHLQVLDKTKCYTCCNGSRLEQDIEDYLIENDVKYVREKTFKGCRDKISLRFDFYLPEYNHVIEVNGAQHYIEVDMFIDTLAERQRRDKIKLNYCLNHDIGYTAIPYWDITGHKANNKYKETINKILK